MSKTDQDNPGVTNVAVKVIWDPPWSSMMSEAAKLELGERIGKLHAYNRHHTAPSST
jgi:metal-sulfur cluster biosynthetic enzyme